MAVKKDSLDTNSYHTKLASGDDVFLLHHMKKNKKDIRVLKSPNHLVTTDAPANMRAFFEQRKRWASKATQYTDMQTTFIAAIVFLVSLFLLRGFIIAIVEFTLQWALLTFGLKLVVDLYLFIKGKDIFSYKDSLMWLPVISFVYPFYILLTSITAIKSPFFWKGRKYDK